ncbi:MAG: serine/threonine protein kinase [Planctomycetia bacterium]|nr:serine/threonine protein kinase [Planctomycetia bacterium]
MSATLAHFDLLALAGCGTFADVWQVRDRRTGHVCAIKQLRSEWLDRPAARQILRNEADVGRRVSSEFVVKVFDAVLDSSIPHIVLEWLTGTTLEAKLAGGQRLPCREALWVARQCASGMHALLIAGYTHGDIKPSNLFLCDDGIVKLIDLGFARPDQLAAPDLCGAGGHLTGTPEYLAPETLVPGHPGGIARDVYSLGITLYRMLTGVLPFQGESIAEILKQHQTALPAKLRSLAPEVPREVGEFVHRLLSKQPLRRGGGLTWLIHELIGLELSVLPTPN